MHTSVQSVASPGRRPGGAFSQLAALTVSWCTVFWYLYSIGGRPSAECIAVPLLFTVLGIALRGVTVLGALTGLGYAFLFYAISGRTGFFVLFMVFLLTLGATRLSGWRRGEKTREPRDATQVAANLAVAGILIVFAETYSRLPLVFAAFASLAEVAADTVSSEIGSAFGGNTRSIWGFNECPAGTEGGISLIGTLAGLIAAAGTALASSMLYAEDRWMTIAALVCAAMIGTLFDSIAGATLERRGYIGNNLVNLVGTGAAALVFVGINSL